MVLPSPTRLTPDWNRQDLLRLSDVELKKIGWSESDISGARMMPDYFPSYLCGWCLCPTSSYGHDSWEGDEHYFHCYPSPFAQAIRPLYPEKARKWILEVEERFKNGAPYWDQKEIFRDREQALAKLLIQASPARLIETL
jgi:hypothetical protein